MAVNMSPSDEKINAAIDMDISMVVEDLVEILHKPEEEVLPSFLESSTCAFLYDQKTKLWWDGPSVIVEMYLDEMQKSGIDTLEKGCTSFEYGKT